METFLQQVARSIIDRMDWKQLSRTTLVLPSHRAGLVLKNELLCLQKERHAQAVWAPTVQTLTQLQDSLSPLYPEDELFTIVRLYKLYIQSPLSNLQSPIMSLDMFYGWGRQMLSDFTNVDASMPAEQVPNFFENTIAAHELSQWNLDPEVEERLRALINPISNIQYPISNDSVRNQYEVLWRQLYELYTALRAQMKAEQKGYAGLRQRAVIEEWSSEPIQSKIQGRTFVFVGFNYLLPVERELMQLLRDQDQALFYWDFVPDFTTNPKAFSFAQLNSGILGNALPPNPLTTNPLTPKRPVTVISCVSKEAQAQYVHRWLQENYTAKGQKVGVVICDETMLEPVIYALPAIQLPDQDTPEPINITKGFPLRNTDVYARVIAWVYDRARGKAEDTVSPDFIDQLIAAIFPESTDLDVSTSRDLELSPLKWQDLLILESEYQVRKIVNQMRLLLTEGIGVPFTLKLLRLLMRRTMESVTMPFHGEPVTDIQVMGVLETRLLDFDKLLLLNVDEGILPQRQTDNSFIPFYLRKAYHMQTSDEKATIYAYNFFRLLSRSGHTTLLYGQPDTLGGSRGMSRFIMQILYSDAFDVTRAELTEPNTLRPITNHQSPITNIQYQISNRLSPSALNTFISCPKQFYYLYIEHLHPGDEKETQFEDNTIGSFVHHAMEHIYRHEFHCDDIHPTTVLPDQIEAIIQDETKLQEALMAAYDAMESEENKHFLPSEHVAENVIIKGYVRNILERDREDAKIGLQVYHLEYPCYFPVEIEGIGTIQTGGKIDRLDIFGPEGNQTLRVVDYKSGGYSASTHADKMSASWDEIMEDDSKSYVRQTMIYSHAVMANDDTGLPIEPHLFFCRRKLTDIVTTLDVDNTPVRDYRSISEPFYEALQTKIRQVLTTTDFPMCEDGKCPPHCKFFQLCGRKPKDF